MKKIVCILLAFAVLAATAAVLGGCGKEKTKSSKSASTEADATVPPAELSTLSPSASELPASEHSEGDDTQAKGADNHGAAYDSVYGGISGQEAILKALDAVGAGYQCVFYSRRNLRNQEAWYLGIRTSDGSDSTVYHLYVNQDRCVPEEEIPNIGGDNRRGSGIFEESFAGIAEQEAIFKALDTQNEDHLCVSSEQSALDGREYWLIGIRQSDAPDAEIKYLYVDRDSCIVQ